MISVWTLRWSIEEKKELLWRYAEKLGFLKDWLLWVKMLELACLLRKAGRARLVDLLCFVIEVRYVDIAGSLSSFHWRGRLVFIFFLAFLFFCYIG